MDLTNTRRWRTQLWVSPLLVAIEYAARERQLGSKREQHTTTHFRVFSKVVPARKVTSGRVLIHLTIRSQRYVARKTGGARPVVEVPVQPKS